jgi:hypothetical protein
MAIPPTAPPDSPDGVATAVGAVVGAVVVGSRVGGFVSPTFCSAPVPVEMRERVSPDPSAAVGGASPLAVPVQMWKGWAPVPVHMRLK